MNFEQSIAAQQRLHEIVPSGAHTYARAADQYPENMAPVLVRGHGAHVWDLDGNEFIEYGMGLRSVTLGHAYTPVIDAVRAVLPDGVNFTRPTALELAAAEDFLSIVPGADMVKFAKNGSDATTAAVRLARAATGRVKIAICDQPFYSTDDWFITSVGMNAGIPDSVAAQTVRFHYNSLQSLDNLFAEHSIACVVMEAATATAEPDPGFLEGVRSLCDRHGAVLIFDEMITGFRWALGGAQSVYGVTPDLSTWGKAMGNGFPISALAGRRSLMELGGLNTDHTRAFLLSTTHGPESVGLAAFRAVVKAYRSADPVAIMTERGAALTSGVNAVTEAHGIGAQLRVIGRPSCAVFTTKDPEGKPSQEFRTLFLAELLNRGILGQSFVVSAAHTETDIARTIAAVDEAAVTYRQALESGSTRDFLTSRPVAPALRANAAPRRL